MFLQLISKTGGAAWKHLSSGVIEWLIRQDSQMACVDCSVG